MDRGGGYHIPGLRVKTEQAEAFHAPRPGSPTGNVKRYTLPLSTDDLRPYDDATVKSSMETLLTDILTANSSNARDPLQFVDKAAKSHVSEVARALRNEVQRTDPHDKANLRALRKRVIELAYDKMLGNLRPVTRARGTPQKFLPHDMLSLMGNLLQSEMFDGDMRTAAANRLKQIDASGKENELIAAAIWTLSRVTQLLRMLCTKGSNANHSTLMFSLGQRRGKNEMKTLSGTFCSVSGVPEKEMPLLHFMRRLRSGEFVPNQKFAKNYPDELAILKEAWFAGGNIQGEDGAGTPSFPLILRRMVSGDKSTAVNSGSGDAEYKNLANLLHKLEEQGFDLEKLEGRIYLYSDYPYCGSCINAVKRFKEICPGVDIMVVPGVRAVASKDSVPDDVDSRLTTISAHEEVSFVYNDWFESRGWHISGRPDWQVPAALSTSSTSPSPSSSPTAPIVEFAGKPVNSDDAEFAMWKTKVSQSKTESVTVDRVNCGEAGWRTVAHRNRQWISIAADFKQLLDGQSQVEGADKRAFAEAVLGAMLDRAVSSKGGAGKLDVTFKGQRYDIDFQLAGRQVTALTVMLAATENA
jgi:hypothetical protein